MPRIRIAFLLAFLAATTHMLVRAEQPGFLAHPSSFPQLSELDVQSTSQLVLERKKRIFASPALRFSSGGFNAVSLAITDINLDGHPDLVMVNVNDNLGGVSVLLGNGDGTFQPARTSFEGFVTSAAAADVNHDGKPDLIVGNGASIVVLLGNGDATFQVPTEYPVSGAVASAIAVADVNGDGNVDVVAALTCLNSCPAGNSFNGPGGVAVLLGNGDGTFQPAVGYGAGGWDSDSVAVADLNGDGKPDIVVSNIYDATATSSSVGVLLGNGDGTFGSAALYNPGGFVPGLVFIADVNSDGIADIVVANGSLAFGTNNPDGTVGVLLGNGDGTFQPAAVYDSMGYSASAVAIADVNGDGVPDIIVLNAWRTFQSYLGGVTVLLGKGDGTFQFASPTYGSGGMYGSALVVGDFNGDGKPDLAVANEFKTCNLSTGNCSGPGYVGILLNETTGP